jgi:16S rRNA G966 N2-methylase RsmD
MDIITNYFTEDARMQAIVANQGISPLNWWNNPKNQESIFKELYEEQSDITSETLREKVFQHVKEATLFKVSLAKSVIDLLTKDTDIFGQNPILSSSLKQGGVKGEPGFPLKKDGYRILDISSGWGDRLIASIAAGASRYLGFDPNTLLKPGHSEIIETLAKDFTGKFEVRYEPFEKAILPDEKFDLVFTSPPYFDFEIYSKDQSQSMSAYPKYETWLVEFLFAALSKAWNVLEDGGYMAIHIADTKSMYRVCEQMLLFVQGKLDKSNFIGIISSQAIVIDENGKPSYKPRRPIWVWKKAEFDSYTMLEKSKEANYLGNRFYSRTWKQL